MAHLKLSNPKTKTCDFELMLSNPFNTDYYRKIRITGDYYGDATDDVRRYVESIEAEKSYDFNYVYGEVNDGMSEGRTYTLHAYAQARNGTWYIAGSYTITMKNDGEADLRIVKIIPYTDIDEFKVGERVTFKVIVKNIGDVESSKYTVKVYGEKGNIYIRF
ncbi:MAG: hypothetical protein N4A48_09625 [Tepidibacter sp.]|jgi:hypothetical protein|uniref:hypothetical protein n=1 Tax=Tepidibacter sp. TaxID=2529387 RepID=UPI0025CBC54A|nr:hypothetical protein [Tepidibacter sp.]MCT4509004.1 hypothetical protein [Tepidibacter sp.]